MTTQRERTQEAVLSGVRLGNKCDSVRREESDDAAEVIMRMVFGHRRARRTNYSELGRC